MAFISGDFRGGDNVVLSSSYNFLVMFFKEWNISCLYMARQEKKIYIKGSIKSSNWKLFLDLRIGCHCGKYKSLKQTASYIATNKSHYLFLQKSSFINVWQVLKTHLCYSISSLLNLETFIMTFIKWLCNPVNIYLFKVNNRETTKRCEICSKLTIKTPDVTFVTFEQTSHLFLFLVSLLLTLNK